MFFWLKYELNNNEREGESFGWYITSSVSHWQYKNYLWKIMYSFECKNINFDVKIFLMTSFEWISFIKKIILLNWENN